MKSKVCAHCNNELPLLHFHNNSRQKDGKHYYCKACKNSIAQKWNAKHPRQAVERSYRWRKTAKGKASLAATYRKMKQRYPDKYKARTQLNNAIASGTISRPSHCSICGKIGRRIVAHHPDYAKPLDVVWCCDTCHRTLGIL